MKRGVRPWCRVDSFAVSRPHIEGAEDRRGGGWWSQEYNPNVYNDDDATFHDVPLPEGRILLGSVKYTRVQ